MLWLYLLAAVTVLIIALRRVLRRQKPLYDELYSTRVAIKHVHSGVAWVESSGKIGFVNESLAGLTAAKATDLTGSDWYSLFPAALEQERVREAYAQMLLSGIASLDTTIERRGGSHSDAVNLRLVAVHDRKARFVGHHVLVHDVSRERALENQLRQLSQAVGTSEPVAPQQAQATPQQG